MKKPSMSTKDGAPCPLCSSPAFTSWRYGLLKCLSCGLVLSPAVWERGINEAVNADWFGEGYEGRRSSLWIRLFEAHNSARTLDRLSRLPLTGKRMLEVGVGSGGFLRAALKAGYVVEGCDLSEPICRQIRRDLGVPMHCGPLDRIRPEGGFDVIVMNHVLEHVEDPIGFLKAATDLLASGGAVHLAVPNVGCWEARLSGWVSYEPYHLTYFNANTIRLAASKVGLEGVSLDTHESFSGWFLSALRTLLGVNKSSDRVVRGASGNGSSHAVARRYFLVEQLYRATMVIIGLLSFPIRYVQAALGRGDELILLARRPANPLHE